MITSTQLAAATLAASIGAAQAFDGHASLVFTKGQAVQIEEYDTDVPLYSKSGSACADGLGDRAITFEEDARKTKALDGWTLQSIQCLAPGDHWAKVIQRVPVDMNLSADGEGK